MAFFFLGHFLFSFVFFICCLPFWSLFVLIKLFNEYLQHFLNIQRNNYRMPCENKKQFFKGVVHEQPCSSIVCLLWRSSIVSNFCLEHFIFHNPALLSFSFPLLKRFSFYFLSSILLEISICLISISQKSLISCVHTHTHEAGAWCSTWWCAAWVTGHDVTVELFAIISWQMQFMGLLLVTWGYYLEHGVIVCEKFKNTVLK